MYRKFNLKVLKLSTLTYIMLGIWMEFRQPGFLYYEGSIDWLNLITGFIIFTLGYQIGGRVFTFYKK